MVYKRKWLAVGFILMTLLSTFACWLPGKLIRSISQIITTVSATSHTGITPPASQTPESSSPSVSSSAGIPGSSAETMYPVIELTITPPVSVTGIPSPASETTYPGLDTLVPAITTKIGGYPGSGTDIPPGQITATVSPVATNVAQATGASGTGSPSPTYSIDVASTSLGLTSQTTQTPYPEAGSTQVGPITSAYPGLASSETVIQTQDTATISTTQAPGGITIDTPTLTIIYPSDSQSTLIATPTFPSVNISPMTSPSNALTTGSPTPTNTVFFVPTSTLTPTKTPFLTPTPTITPTPTKTRTPLPFPPWVSSKLRATDPHTVKLASGKVQLVELFAFWSGPCQAMSPLLQGLEKEYRSSINFIYLDIDNPANKTFMRQLGFRMEPHFLLLDSQGNILKQWIGYVTVEQFRKAFDTALQ